MGSTSTPPPPPRPVTPRSPSRPTSPPPPEKLAVSALEVCERMALYGEFEPFTNIFTTPCGMQMVINLDLDDPTLYTDDAPIVIQSGFAPTFDRRAA